MKRRATVAPMKSAVGKRDKALFTTAERQHFERAQQRDGHAPGRMAAYWFDHLYTRLAAHYDRLHEQPQFVAMAEDLVKQRYEKKLWDDAGFDPSLAWRAVVAAVVLVDINPDEAPDDVVAKAGWETARERVTDVLNQADLFDLDPAISDEWIVYTNGEAVEDAGTFDLVELSHLTKELVAEVDAMEPKTLDHWFEEVKDAGGRQFAYVMTEALRRRGHLPKLKATKGEVKVIERSEWERLGRLTWGCTGLGCFCGEPAELTSWSDVVENGSVEAGRIAVFIREEEHPVTRQMQRIILFSAPSRIEWLEHEAEHRNHHRALEVRA
jgi:hypothetical protein